MHRNMIINVVIDGRILTFTYMAAVFAFEVKLNMCPQLQFFSDTCIVRLQFLIDDRFVCQLHIG